VQSTQKRTGIKPGIKKSRVFAVEPIGKTSRQQPDAPALKAYAEARQADWLVERWSSLIWVARGDNTINQEDRKLQERQNGNHEFFDS